MARQKPTHDVFAHNNLATPAWPTRHNVTFGQREFYLHDSKGVSLQHFKHRDQPALTGTITTTDPSQQSPDVPEIQSQRLPDRTLKSSQSSPALKDRNIWQLFHEETSRQGKSSKSSGFMITPTDDFDLKAEADAIFRAVVTAPTCRTVLRGRSSYIVEPPPGPNSPPKSSLVLDGYGSRSLPAQSRAADSNKDRESPRVRRLFRRIASRTNLRRRPSESLELKATKPWADTLTDIEDPRRFKLVASTIGGSIMHTIVPTTPARQVKSYVVNNVNNTATAQETTLSPSRESHHDSTSSDLNQSWEDTPEPSAPRKPLRFVHFAPEKSTDKGHADDNGQAFSAAEKVHLFSKSVREQSYEQYDRLREQKRDRGGTSPVAEPREPTARPISCSSITTYDAGIRMSQYGFLIPFLAEGQSQSTNCTDDSSFPSSDPRNSGHIVSGTQYPLDDPFAPVSSGGVVGLGIELQSRRHLVHKTVPRIVISPAADTNELPASRPFVRSASLEGEGQSVSETTYTDNEQRLQRQDRQYLSPDSARRPKSEGRVRTSKTGIKDVTHARNAAELLEDRQMVIGNNFNDAVGHRKSDDSSHQQLAVKLQTIHPAFRFDYTQAVHGTVAGIYSKLIPHDKSNSVTKACLKMQDDLELLLNVYRRCVASGTATLLTNPHLALILVREVYSCYCEWFGFGVPEANGAGHTSKHSTVNGMDQQDEVWKMQVDRAAAPRTELQYLLGVTASTLRISRDCQRLTGDSEDLDQLNQDLVSHLRTAMYETHLEDRSKARSQPLPHWLYAPIERVSAMERRQYDFQSGNQASESGANISAQGEKNTLGGQIHWIPTEKYLRMVKKHELGLINQAITQSLHV